MELFDEGTEEHEMQWHIVEVAVLPKCDFCRNSVNAKFDGKMNDMRGMWANFCDFHWYELGVGKTGLGMGQRLVVK
jgi:hypothetical protein